MPELRAKQRGHSGDQGEQRAAGGPARLFPFGGQREWVPSHRVGVREGCLELLHIYFFIMTTAPVLNVFPLFDDARGGTGMVVTT